MADYFAMAVENLKGHRGRTLLTGLGVAVGTFLIVVVMFVGSSFKAKMKQEVKFGADRAIVMTAGRKSNLSYQLLPIFDSTSLSKAKGSSGAKRVVPIGVYNGMVNPPNMVVGGQKTQIFSPIIATEPDYFSTYGLTFANGKAFHAKEGKVVVGAAVAKRLKLDVGDKVILNIPEAKLGPRTLRVAGILEKKADSLFGNNAWFNEIIVLPWRYWTQPNFMQILVEASPDSDVRKVEQGLERKLRTAEVKARLGSQYELIGLSQADSNSLVNQWLTNIQLFVFIVAFIALFIGGIGVLNIMFVALRERRRDIGILKALGAKSSQVTRVFLIEASIIGGIGGTIGSIFGYIAGFGIAWLASFPPLNNLLFPIAGLVVGALSGILSGLYPAISAGRLKPAEVLAYE